MSVSREYMTRSKTRLSQNLNKENVTPRTGNQENTKKSKVLKKKLEEDKNTPKNKLLSLVKNSEISSPVELNMVSSPFTNQQSERILGRGSLGQVFYSPKRKTVTEETTSGTLDRSTVVAEKNMNLKAVTQPCTNGVYFLEIVAKQVEELESGADLIDEMLNECTNEEANGILRAAAGKARLLVAEKINQFIGLCHKNINCLPGENFPTTDDDLAGFWDMVMIQVNQVLDQFKEINLLKENNWKIIDTGFNNNRIYKKIQKPKTVGGNDSRGLTEAAKARDAIRKKIIMERKLAMKQKAVNENVFIVN